jgi:hypothetical protein
MAIRLNDEKFAKAVLIAAGPLSGEDASTRWEENADPHPQDTIANIREWTRGVKNPVGTAALIVALIVDAWDHGRCYGEEKVRDEINELLGN